MRAMKTLRILLLTAVAVSLAACQSLYEPPPSSPRPSTPPSGTPQPSPPIPTPQEPTPEPVPPPPPPPQKEFRLSAASAALVKQGREQSIKGEYQAAIATLERAVRIEPDNPLVWLELGQTHLSARNAPQAESMGRKAVALATGNTNVQANAWRLIGDALRARGRDVDASEAYQRASMAAPR
jgi:tetratricopeptide (TPR) repeat protein